MRQLVILEGAFAGRTFALKPGLMTIGRGNDSGWVIADDSISRYHCEIRLAAEEVRVRDLDSTNGTFIDEQPVREGALLPGQVLRLGNIRIALDENPRPAPRRDFKDSFAQFAESFRYLQSPSVQSHLVRGITAVLAGIATAYVIRTWPYYPSEWRFLLVLTVMGVWFFRPVTGMAIALIGLILPVGYNLSLGVAAAFLLFSLSLRPYSFLLFSAMLLMLADPAWTSFLPAIPLAAGLAGKNRGPALAGFACLLTEFFLLINGKTRANLIGGAGAHEPLFPVGNEPVKSLLDFSWIEGRSQMAPDLWSQLARPFVEYPLLIGQVLVWVMAATSMTWILKRPFKWQFAPLSSVAVGLGGLVLLLGHLGLALAFPWSDFSAYTTVASVLFATFLVGLIAPLLVSTPALLASETGGSREGAGAALAGSAALVKKEIPSDTWRDLVGIDDIQDELKTAIQSQFDPAMRAELNRLSLRPTKGILLFGPPGTGKTCLARVIAHEASAAFFAVSGTEFTSKWFGESEANLRQIFETAMQNKPAVLFFDELEAFLPRRTELSRSDAPEKGIVATFLAYTDGLANLDGVFMVGATNHPNLIDPAALRPGRFDKLIYLSAPNARARSLIFEKYLLGKPLAKDIDFAALGAITERFTGADIESVCKEAAMSTLKQGSRLITREELDAVVRGTKPSVTIQMQREYEEIADRYGRRARKQGPVEVVARSTAGWKDVAGLEKVKDALREAIEMPLLHADVLQSYGVKPSRGVLLFGPPGCGKTLLAKVVAHESQAHFLHVKGPELLREHTGQSETRLRELFTRARENTPCVLFFDEIDALAGTRGTVFASPTQILTQFLTEMDGIEELKGVVVLAATNRPDVLDPALLRPGRFDRIIYVPPPDLPARCAIFHHELVNKPMATGLDLDALAQATQDYSAADIVNVCNGAAYETAKDQIRSGSRQWLTMERLLRQIQSHPPSISPDQIRHYQELFEEMQR
jgi:transitional endoplasmic reticulum ATPase